MNIETLRDSLKLALIDDVEINIEQMKEIKWIQPSNLLCVERFYFVIKYKYAEMLDKGISNQYIKDVYDEHIRVFSNGSYVEPGQENTKNSIEKYHSVFTELFFEMKERGYDSEKSFVIVNNRGITMDGSHRVGIALYLGIDIPIYLVNKNAFIGDYNFFVTRGMKKEYLEYMVEEYIKLKKTCRILCVWPKAIEQNRDIKDIEDIIEEKSKIAYKKEVQLSDLGIRNILIHCYMEKEWIGSIDNKWSGIDNKKAEVCSKICKTCIFYIVDVESDVVFSTIKEKVRQYYSIGNASVHGTDNIVDTRRLSDIIFNEEAIYTYNFFDIWENKEYLKLIERFVSIAEEQGEKREDILIDSSGILNFCGIRKAGDIDYLLRNSDKQLSMPSDINAENHHEDLIYHACDKEVLFTDSKNFIIFNGFKILSLNALLRFKKKRNSTKDRKDILLIEECERNINHG